MGRHVRRAAGAGPGGARRPALREKAGSGGGLRGICARAAGGGGAGGGGGGGGGGAPGSALQLHKKWGQHLLRNPGVLDKVTAAAEIKSTDTVLEIGPGTGNLTMRLLGKAHRVRALDVDERMVVEVKKRALRSGHANLEVRHGDALRADFGAFDVCTANLPYQISSPFVFRLIAHPGWRAAVLMFQKEFAERLLAKTGEKMYCRLSLNVQLFCRVDRVATVKAASFNPPPKVDSMLVKLTPRRPPVNVNFKEWDGLIRICFLRKNRLLRANFATKTAVNLVRENYEALREMRAGAAGAANDAAQKAAPMDCDGSLPSASSSGTGDCGLPPVSDYKQFILNILASCMLADRRALSVSMDEYLQLLLAFNRAGVHFRSFAADPAGANGTPGSPFDGTDPEDFYMGMLDDGGASEGE